MADGAIGYWLPVVSLDFRFRFESESSIQEESRRTFTTNSMKNKIEGLSPRSAIR